MTKLEEIARAIEPIIARPPSREDIDFGMGKYRAKEIARAAVEAMHEPTKEMTEHAYKTMEIDSPDESYRHMIDAILNEKPQ